MSMELMRSCRCCLRRLADKDLTTPYTHLGKTEIYADMLKECFDLHLWVSGSMFRGICSSCVARLRDAAEFKLQVRRCQLELLEQLQGSKLTGEAPMKTQMTDDEGSEDMSLSVKKSKPERAQWNYSVRLERLLVDAERHTIINNPTTPTNFYQCHDCAKHFKLKKALTRHIRFNCPIGALTAYNKKHRKPDKKFMNCNYCSYRSKNERNLYHHEMKHIGEKPYQCDSCDYKTGRKADIERHLSIHSGRKPYKCNFCDYSCIQKYTLLIHKRIHTGEKPYACSNCDARFSRVQCFQKHLKQHKAEAAQYVTI